MLVWDTHLQGLAVSDSSIRAKPDMLLCQGYAEAANVVSVVEAKSSLIEANNRVDVAFSLLSGWSSYKGLKRSAALGYLLLWETHLWRSGTSSRAVRADALDRWASVSALHLQASKPLCAFTTAPRSI